MILPTLSEVEVKSRRRDTRHGHSVSAWHAYGITQYTMHGVYMSACCGDLCRRKSCSNIKSCQEQKIACNSNDGTGNTDWLFYSCSALEFFHLTFMVTMENKEIKVTSSSYKKAIICVCVLCATFRKSIKTIYVDVSVCSSVLAWLLKAIAKCVGEQEEKRKRARAKYENSSILMLPFDWMH